VSCKSKVFGADQPTFPAVHTSWAPRGRGDRAETSGQYVKEKKKRHEPVGTRFSKVRARRLLPARE